MTDPTRDPRGRPDDDLRALLAHAVDDVEPTPALDQIRDRTKATPMSDKRPWLYGFLGAAVATAATVVAVTVLSNDETTPVAGSGETPSATAEPSESAEITEGTPSATPTEPAATETVPVYYVGRTPAGDGLYREFVAFPIPDGPVAAAVEAALGTPPSDDDYSSPWTDLPYDINLTAAVVDDDGITLELTADAPWEDRPSDLSAEEADRAVAQLVWTATAAAQENVPVTFEVNGSEAGRLVGVDVAGGERRGDAMSVLAPVWVTSPQDGDTVGSTFAVEGQGAFFEATVSWQLLDSSGEVVEEGFTTAEECCVMSPYRFQVKGVDPGDYTLRVYQADTSGEPGAVETEDTKRVTVE